MSSGRVVHVHIGQAGCQMGHAVWELYCLEHGVKMDGRAGKWSACARDTADSAFVPYGTRYTPRAIMCDTEPTVIDEIRNGAYRQLFAPNFLISDKEGAAVNYAVGSSTVGKAILKPVTDAVRRQAEMADRLEGFLLFHSYGGGTGSGFTPMLMKKMRRDFGKKSIIQMAVYPSPKLATGIVEPYNTVACMKAAKPYSNGVILIDNEAMYAIMQKYFAGIKNSDYAMANRLCAQVISSLTSAFRFKGEQNASFDDISTNLVPYPHLVYLMPSYAPLIAVHRQRFYERRSAASSLLSEAMTDDNLFVKVSAKNKPFLTAALMFRGAISVAEGRIILHEFFPHIIGQVKIMQNDSPPTKVPKTGIELGPAALAVLTNTPAVVTKFRNLGRKFDSMFSQGAFLATYHVNGYSRDQFVSARMHLAELVAAYMSCVEDPSVYDGAIAGKEAAKPEENVGYKMRYSRSNT